MAQKIGRLSALKVEKINKPGVYPDGGGLYLQVVGPGGKSWIFRFKLHGREKRMGLGPLSAVSLAEARRKASDARRLQHDGVNPIDARRAVMDQGRLEAAKSMTFKECAEAYIASHKAGWSNAKHADQWANTLTTYAYPVFGFMPVQEVNVALVTKVIEPLWKTKTETASRLRGRIEVILDWATVRGHREGDNPARWRGRLQSLLPPKSRVHPVEHHPALPHSEIGAFLHAVRQQEGTAAVALELVILTATRTSETIAAKWDEFDLDKAVWTIPPKRIKTRREHRVPLSSTALAVLRRMKKAQNGQYVFPGGKAGRPLSNMALLALLKRMNRTDLTVHGFRSTFRDWAAEMTGYPSEVVEMALAHAVSNKVEAAYRRSDLFDKRRPLMEKWAEYCAKPAAATSDKVVPIGGGKSK